MLKNNPALSSNGFSSYKTPVMGSEECRSVSSPPNNLLKSSQGGRKTPQLKNSVSSFTKGVISNQQIGPRGTILEPIKEVTSKGPSRF